MCLLLFRHFCAKAPAAQAKNQGFPDDFHFINKRSIYNLSGNAVPVHMGAWVGKEVMRYFG